MARAPIEPRLQRVIVALSPAEKWALSSAIEIDGDLHPRLAVRLDVRSRMIGKGLLSTKPAQPLLKLGREIRAVLLELDRGEKPLAAEDSPECGA